MNKKFNMLLSATLSVMLVAPVLARGGGARGGGGGGGMRGAGGAGGGLRAAGGGGGGMRAAGGGGGGMRGAGGAGGGLRAAGGGGSRGGFNAASGGGFGGRAPSQLPQGGMASMAGNRQGAGGFNRGSAANAPQWSGNRMAQQPSVGNQLPSHGNFNGNRINNLPGMAAMPTRPVQLPAQGGLASMAGARQLPSQPINRENLNNQANNIRNSFNQYNQNNFVRNVNYPAYGGGQWNNWHNGWWGNAGAWYPPNWSAATGWAFAGTAAISGLLGLTVGALSSVPAPVVYQGDTVVVNGQPYCSAEQYYDQALQLAMTQPPAVVSDDWQPLGVFGLATPGSPQATMMLQLAINQNGQIAGNYLNQVTGETATISGWMDSNTQRVTFMIGNNNNIVYDTSLPALMQGETTLLVHYGAENTQQMVLVRVPQPPQVVSHLTESKFPPIS